VIDLDFMAEKANELEMVQWDRAILTDDQSAMYGWTPGEQPGRFDFVMLWFWFDPEPAYTFATSSTRHSPTINQIVAPGTPHNDCQPVQVVFGDALQRMVER
jgi:hypothetical protein